QIINYVKGGSPDILIQLLDGRIHRLPRPHYGGSEVFPVPANAEPPSETTNPRYKHFTIRDRFREEITRPRYDATACVESYSSGSRDGSFAFEAHCLSSCFFMESSSANISGVNGVPSCNISRNSEKLAARGTRLRSP